MRRVVLQRKIGPSYRLVAHSAIDERNRLLRIDRDRSREIRDGVPAPRCPGKRNRPVQQRVGKLRITRNRFAVVANGFLELSV